MKYEGSVENFDGYYGIIKDNKFGELYLLIKNEINDDVIEIGDKISFVPETYKKNNYERKIARFVRKLDNKNDISIFSKK